MFNILKCENINVNDINLSCPKKINDKYLSIPILDKDCVNNLFLQIKKIITPTGIYFKDGKSYIDINITDKRYLKIFHELELHCIKQVYQNYSKWFDQNNNEDILESSFVSFLKINGSSTILTVPINIVNDNVNCEIYNNDKNRIHYSKIEKNDIVSIIICFNGIQFFSNNFLIDWNISQIKLHDLNHSKNINTYKLAKNICHILESSDDEDYDNNSNIIDDLDEIEYINNEIIKNYEFEEEYNKII